MAHRSLTLSRAFHPIRTPKSILLYLNLFYCVLSITYIYIYIEFFLNIPSSLCLALGWRATLRRVEGFFGFRI